MDFLSLNLDVMQTILSFVHPFDALQLAMTCRAMHAVSMSCFLSDVVLGDLSGDGPRQMAQFCTYMLADISQRILRLKVLTLKDSAFRARGDPDPFPRRLEYDYSSAPALAQILHHAVQLRKIDIDRAEYLFEAAPIVADVLASHPCLRDIRFVNIGSATLSLLSRMVSRPRTVELDVSDALNDAREAKPSELLAYGQNRLLENFTESLEEVKLSRRPSILEDLEPDTVWPAVHQLHLWGDIKSLTFFAHAFPNLHQLRVSTVHVEDVLNVACWPRLDHIITRKPIPIACPVRRVELRFDVEAVMGSRRSSWLSGTLAMLQHISPVVLSCYPNMQILRCIKETVASLKVLQISINQSDRSYVTTFVEFHAWIETYLPLLANVPLVGISIARPKHHSLDRFQLAKLASTVASHVQTLEYVGLGLNTAAQMWTRHPHIWYQIKFRPEAEPPILVELSQSAGVAVAHKLHNMSRA